MADHLTTTTNRCKFPPDSQASKAKLVRKSYSSWDHLSETHGSRGPDTPEASVAPTGDATDHASPTGPRPPLPARRLPEPISTPNAVDRACLVIVVIPINHVGVSTRRLLASGELGPVTDQGRGWDTGGDGYPTWSR